MKTLQKHLNESLITEAYKPKYTPKDWDNVLSGFKPKYGNYSQLGGLEDFIDDGDTSDEIINDWIHTMISGGIQDTPEHREILTDIFMWALDNYTVGLLGWRDDTEGIIDRVNNMDPDEWAVSEEDYARFVYPKKKLTGSNKKYGEVLAEFGDSGEVAEIASQYEEEYGGDDNW